MTQMEFEAHARNTDPSTSHAAAASVTGIRDSQIAVLACLQTFGSHHGLTDEALAMVYSVGVDQHEWPEQSDSGLRTRRKELVTRGLVRDSGRRERLLSGRSAIVWEVVPW